MEKQRVRKRSEISELREAIVTALVSVGLVIGALSISLVDEVEGSEVEKVRVSGLLGDRVITIDPELQYGESLLVTVPDSLDMMGQSVRMADGDLEPPDIRTLDVPPTVWKDLEYLLTIVGGDDITEYRCVVDPESISEQQGSVSYELECVK